MDDTTMYTPCPLRPVLEEAKMRFREDEQWLNIKAIIAAIAVPKPGVNQSDSFSESSTPVDETETSRLLLPKVVESAEAYGTFNTNLTRNTNTAEEAEHTVVPLHPTTLLASAALTPVYLILMLLPLLPFWIFASFLVYVAATSPLSETHITLVALAFLLPFNTIGTVAIIRFAMSEREKALQAVNAEQDVESCSPVSRRSRGSSGNMGSSGEKRLWRPSMQFVLHGARREGRRM